MLASTIQISNNTPTNPHTTLTHDASKGEPTRNTKPPNPQAPSGTQTLSYLILQDPTVCLDPSNPRTHPTFHTHNPERSSAVLRNNTRELSKPFIDDSTSEHHHTQPIRRRLSGHVLLRKEVIQPHLPVRLPCYDFVPIASPTFDGSLNKGWATGFGCCRLS